jgi:hypothetical protein
MVQRDQAHQMKMAQEMRKAQVDTTVKDLETAASIRRKGLETPDQSQ